MSTDAELLQSYAENGSERSFRAFVERRLPVVYSAALRQLGSDSHRAEEVAQTVFTLVARKARSLSRHPAVVGWLYTTTFHTSDKLRRRELRRDRLAREAQTMTEVPSAAPDRIDWDRLRPVLDEFMVALSERDRTAILLRFFSNQSFREIGERYGLSENAARMRVDRALEAMRHSLARRGITSSAAAIASALLAHAVPTAPPGLAGTIAASALGSAAAGTAIFLMSSTFLKTAAVVGVVAAASAGLYHQRQITGENARLRTELTALRQQLATAREIAPTSRASEASHVPTSTDTNETPPSAAPESTRAISASPAVAPDLQLRLTHLAEMQNVGRGTPAAAVQTILWAIAHGDETLPTMLFLNKTTLQDAQKLMAGMSPATREKFETPEKIAALYLSKQVLDYIDTVQVQAVKQLDPETVEVSILTGERGPTVVSMQWTPNGWLWKVKPSVIATAKLDLLGPAAAAPAP